MPVTRRTFIKAVPAMGVAMAVPQGLARAQTGNPVASNDNILNSLKIIVASALGYVPMAGNVLSALVLLFWPTRTANVWDALRGQIEALVDQKIDATVYNIYTAKLNGLGDGLKLYLRALASRDPQQIVNYFDAVNVEMTVAAREYANASFGWTLAPLLAILAQLHMSLLRDAVLHGKSWGWSAAAYEGAVEQARTQLAGYIDALNAAAQKRREQYTSGEPSDTRKHARTLIYNYWQPFEAQRVLAISDSVALLKASDPLRNDGAVTEIAFEDVYSLAYGTADDCDWVCKRAGGGRKVAPIYAAPLASFSQIDIEYFNAGPRVVRVSYPAEKGPLRFGTQRTDQYGIEALAQGGVEKAGFSFPAPAPGKRFHVEKARVTHGDTPLGLTLVLDTGEQKALWMRGDLGGQTEEVAVAGRMLTTLNMWTRSKFYDNDLGCIIFGFSRDPDYIPASIKQIAYISAIQEPDTGPRYLPRSIDPALEARRDRFWREIMDPAPR